MQLKTSHLYIITKGMYFTRGDYLFVDVGEFTYF